MSTSFLASCKTPSRKEIEANIWLTNAGQDPKTGSFPIAEICGREPQLQRYGFYRRLNSGKLEFISFCNSESRKWLSVHERDFNRMLDEYLPEAK